MHIVDKSLVLTVNWLEITLFELNIFYIIYSVLKYKISSFITFPICLFVQSDWGTIIRNLHEGFIFCFTTVQIQIEKGIAPKVIHKIHTVWSILTNDNSTGNTCDLVVFLSIFLYWSSVLPATTTTTPLPPSTLSLSLSLSLSFCKAVFKAVCVRLY